MTVTIITAIFIILLLLLFFVEKRRYTALRRKYGHELDESAKAKLNCACNADNCNFYQYRLADFAARTFGIPYPCYEGKGTDDEARIKPGDFVTFRKKDGDGQVFSGEIEVNIDDEGNMLPRCPVCVYDSDEDVRYQLEELSDVRLENRPEYFLDLVRGGE